MSEEHLEEEVVTKTVDHERTLFTVTPAELAEGTRANLTLKLFDTDGEPFKAEIASIKIKADNGLCNVNTIKETSDGVYTASVTKTTPGDETLSYTLDGEPGTVKASLKITAKPEEVPEPDPETEETELPPEEPEVKLPEIGYAKIRNGEAVYLPIGYWVLDAMKRIKKAGGDWKNPDESEPYADTMKLIAALVDNVEGEVYIQESRNGRVLTKAQLEDI